MKFERYRSIAAAKYNPTTLLGVGPMSKLCVDATIELANFLQVPMQIIASRRQIECAEFGGGYVNGWSTEDFAKYVRAQDTGDWIMLARDHGGPWQGTDESDLDYATAIERAKRSYAVDIASGFDVIHLDPSLKDRTLADIERDIEKLFSHCEEIPGEVVYECGTEETNGKTTKIEDFARFVEFCSELDSKVKFVVGQTGTHVKESRNVGVFDAAQALALAKLCHAQNLLLKEHNLDYVPADVLKAHKTCQVDSANVAPEFGLVETRRLLAMLKKYGKRKMLKRFQDLALQSKKWEKWVISDLDDTEKSVIAGHYVLAHPDVKEMYESLNKEIGFDDAVKNDIKGAILKYLRPFGWVW